MKKRNLKNQTNALSGVIEALLLVALVAIIISTIQVMYIPGIMQEREIDHLITVESQFSYLKSNLDIQSMTEEDVLISSVITLGTEDIPFFISARAHASLETNDLISTNYEIVVTGNTTTESGKTQNFPLTSIKFSGRNFYCNSDTYEEKSVYKDYILEGGSIIGYSSQKEKMTAPPSINKKVDANTIVINMSLPVFHTQGGKVSTSGNENTHILTNYSKKERITTYYLETIPNHKIDIKSDYLTAWNRSLNTFFYDEITQTDIKVEKYPSSSPEAVRITPEGEKTIELNIILTHIYVQIGPGITI